MPFVESTPETDMKSFQDHLRTSNRILTVCGAGLSASSGLATFRGAGGLWKTHNAMSLATPEAFNRDPSLVWQFYNARRHKAFAAKPNPAHYALAALSKANPECLTITQNVDGLSPRAGHPADQLLPIHGSLSTIKCTNFHCNYVELNNFETTLTPALAPAPESSVTQDQPDEDADSPPNIPIKDLPHCPECKTGLLRPGVVWFGENLPTDIMETIEDWIDEGPIDLCVVIGTSGRVYPAAGYSLQAKEAGAKVAIVNLDISHDPDLGGAEIADWLFEGDCAKLLPEMFKPIIGEFNPEVLVGDEPEFPPMISSGGPIERQKVGGGSGYY